MIYALDSEESRIMSDTANPTTTDTKPAGTNNTSSPPFRWRDVLPIHPAAELFPLMNEAELRELADDIEKHGLTELVCLYDDQELGVCVLDGRNRLDALELLKWEAGEQAYEPPSERRRLPVGLYQWVERKLDPHEYALSKNVHRRHLTSEQKRDLIAKVLKAKPEASNLQIAKQVKADDKTVAKVRTELEARSEIPNVKTRTDTKGREQPAKKEVSAAEREERDRERMERMEERNKQDRLERYPNAIKNMCERVGYVSLPEIPPGLTAETATVLLPQVRVAIKDLEKLEAALAEIACGADAARRVH
jgi:hypothetical protein